MCSPIKFIYYTWYVICTHGYYFFILSGLGHYEINMVKGVVNFLWKVAFEDLRKRLGFKSPNALASLRACTGKHVFHCYIYVSKLKLYLTIYDTFYFDHSLKTTTRAGRHYKYFCMRCLRSLSHPMCNSVRVPTSIYH